jgi:hypothetical protein
VTSPRIFARLAGLVSDIFLAIFAAPVLIEWGREHFIVSTSNVPSMGDLRNKWNALMVQHKIAQADVAKVSGVHRVHLSRILKGTSEVTMTRAANIDEAIRLIIAERQF